MQSDARIVAETILAGRYRLVRLIDRGGMAEVWEGRDEVLDRPVAVKVLHPQLAGDEEFQERFRREAVAAARLAHPNIVAIFDTGIDGDVAYIIMELVPGRPLRDMLRANGQLPVMRAVAIAAAVADALDYAHQAGIVHRDVKPGNILVGDDGRVKVTDFGIAKAAAGHDLTEAGTMLGTAKYLAPEQVAGKPQDRRSDVYGLGVVLYEMLCGRAPFVGDNDMAVVYQHAHADATRPRQLRPDIPRRLEAVILKAMAKAPEQRYATAGDMRRALLAVRLDHDDGDDEDITTTLYVRDAPSFSQTERSWLVPVVLIVVLAVVLGTVGYLFSRSHTGRDLLGNSGAAAPLSQPVRITDVRAFDPQGDGHEHDADLPKIVDGDPATAWSTEHYDRGGLRGAGKQGVGVVLVLHGVPRLGHLQLASPSQQWTASIYVANSASPDLPGWGKPVVSHTVNGTTSFDLRNHSAGAVLVWITDLGTNQSVSISEARFVS